MDYLVEFAGRDDVRDLATRYLEYDSVQAIDVDLDDLWLAAWRLLSEAPRADFEEGWRYLRYWQDPYRRFRSWPGHPLADAEFVCYPFGLDTGWVPPLGGEDAERWARWGPFTLTVVLRPGSATEELAALREIYAEGLPVGFEARPVPQLLAGPREAVRPLVGGIGVASEGGRPGTLGGVLDTNEGRVALSCAHVLGAGETVEQPAASENRRDAAPIGACVHASELVPHEGHLDPYSPDLNEVDAALVELAEGIEAELEIRELGRLRGITERSRLHPDASVEIVGLRAGRRDLNVGKLRIVGEFGYGEVRYGYQNLFELRRRSRFHGLTGTLRPPVAAGDSGAWVIAPGRRGPEWAGMVVAGDGPYGYGVLAQSVVEWIESQTPYRGLRVA